MARRNVWSLVVVVLGVVGVCSVVSGKVIYVDDDANAPGDGACWETAYRYLQDALADANEAGEPTEIRVAQGIYRPDRGAGQTLGDRDASFHLQDDSTLKGGYAGSMTAAPDDRDIACYETILSGDLLGNDVGISTDFSRSDNSYHVVYISKLDAPTVIEGATITGGNGENFGAVAVFDGFITIRQCRIADNYSYIYGAGIYLCTGGCIEDCVVERNHGECGTGIYIDSRGAKTVVSGCIIRENTAWSNTGLRVRYSDDVTIVNCLLVGNSSYGHVYASGTLIGITSSNVAILCCTIVDNQANSTFASVDVSEDSSLVLANSIFWSNAGVGGVTEALQLDTNTQATIHHCCIQGWTGEIASLGGMIADDPLFVRDVGADELPDTADDNMRLSPLSPCIDTGDNAVVPTSATTDIDGRPRISGAAIDMGAHEGPVEGLLLSTSQLSIPEAGTADFQVTLAASPPQPVQVQIHIRSDASDIHVISSPQLIFDESNYQQPQTVSVAADADSDYLHDQAIILLETEGLPIVGVRVSEVDSGHPPCIVYVDDDADGNHTGENWEQAFTSLNDALSVARDYGGVDEIRIAGGLYKPVAVFNDDRDRAVMFELPEGLCVKGGYAGLGAPDPNVRDARVYRTVLSGDLKGDDPVLETTEEMSGNSLRLDNSVTILCLPGGSTCTVLDGLVVTGANSNLDSVYSGALWINGAPVTIIDCEFTWNALCDESALFFIHDHGAAVRALDVDPEFVNCSFANNYTDSKGGAVSIRDGNAVFADCIFEDNVAQYGGAVSAPGFSSVVGVSGSWIQSFLRCHFVHNRATDRGGAICCYDGSFNASFVKAYDCHFIGNSAGLFEGAVGGAGEFVRCYFEGNSAGLAGGVLYPIFFDNTVTDCVFVNNRAGVEGGAIHLSMRQLTLERCLFAGNLAGKRGGALHLEGTDSTITNCTFSSNRAGSYGGGLYLSYDDTVLGNCIVWGNEPDDMYVYDGGAATPYYNIAGSWPGEGNIQVDPCFASPGCWDSNDTPDDVNDDIWTAGDYHLKSQAGRWDPNMRAWVLDEVTSPCIDAGDPNTSYGLEPWPHGLRANLGVYGTTAEASLSLSPAGFPGDFDLDGQISGWDLSILAEKWLAEGLPLQQDLNLDAKIDAHDMSILGQQWKVLRPGRATDPVPSQRSEEVDALSVVLQWTAGKYASSHRVYFGTSDPPELRGDISEPYFAPGPLERGTLYYWKVDEINDLGVAEGAVWSFTTSSR